MAPGVLPAPSLLGGVILGGAGYWLGSTVLVSLPLFKSKLDVSFVRITALCGEIFDVAVGVDFPKETVRVSVEL